MTRNSVPANLREALRYARDLGWSAARSTDGYKLRHPDGGQTLIHLHATDHRAWRNIAADLRRTEGGRRR